jgi:hypothetical protein
VVALVFGRGVHGHDVGAGIGLGDAEAADVGRRVTSLGMYFFSECFAAVGENGEGAAQVCMLICTRRELETRAISSVTIMAASQPISSPSYSSGITVPKKPSSPMGSMASL